VKKFQNKYRVPSTRLEGWDYSENGYYFVTICTKDKKHYFGKIENEEMKLSEIGKIVAEEWQKTENIRKNIELDKWVVMPNHFHAIVVINNENTPVETPRRGVSTKRHKNHKPEWKPNSLGSIINQFKSICTKRIREINPDFSWQPRYYDHIIFTDREYNEIQDYILNNVANWEKDEENLKC